MAMRPYYKTAAAAIACFFLGAGAVSVLRAQVKLPAFVVAEIDVKDQDGYAKEFLPKAQANIKEHGGKYLAGGLNKAISLSRSPPPNRVVLLQFSDTLVANTPASARSGSRVLSRSDNAGGGGLR
jgi:uncharacterized protein (DUF1330 family)